MKLDGRRESEHFEDRRGMKGSTIAGAGGIGAVIIGVLIALFTGGDPTEALQNMGSIGLGSGQTQTEGQYEGTAEEEEQVTFCKQVLASTEDVWSEVFQSMGKTYRPPTLVFFTGSVQSACGGATAAVGPFYCSGDEKLYIDLSFFQQMENQLQSGGDFARAYVIAHEVGHHVEHLLGTLDKAHAQMQRLNKTQANQVSVRLELLADYYAGVWGHYEDKMFGSLEDGDIEEAINCAQHIGDNYLQERAQGYSQPESFTHGTSAQRMRWLKRGLQTGNMNTTTFTGNYADL